jgi:hypothetical protein
MGEQGSRSERFDHTGFVEFVAALPVDEWHQLVIVVTPTTRTFYVNGEERE